MASTSDTRGVSDTTDRLHQSQNGTPSREEIFEVLSNERRRWTLDYLKRNGEGCVELRDVVDYVTARENDVPIGQIDSTSRKNVYTSMRQSHMPKLDETGIVEYDPQRSEVELTAAARDAEMYLEYSPGRDIPWAEYYLALAAFATAVTVVTYTSVYPFGRLAWPLLTFVIAGLFVVSAIAHVLHTNRNRLGTDQELSDDS